LEGLAQEPSAVEGDPEAAVAERGDGACGDGGVRGVVGVGGGGHERAPVAGGADAALRQDAVHANPSLRRRLHRRAWQILILLATSSNALRFMSQMAE